METVQRDFSAKGVQFYYIYKALAHPETNGYIPPFTLQERLMHVAEAKKKIGSRFTWLCDTMGNDAKHALGDAPNSEFLVGPDGKFVKVRRWSRPEELRTDLDELVGEVENPTSIADIGMRPLAAPKTASKGIVARLQLPGGMTPIEVQPSTGVSLSPPPLPGNLPHDEPLYVKLRAEVDSQYFRAGQGKLYLGFFLDPLYEVHWNNQVAPVAYEIDAPAGVEITPPKGHGPTVQEKADADPREFLLELSGTSADPIKLTVKYFACDDAETFCKPVTQHYLITLQRDRDGGSRRGGGRPPAGSAGPGGGGRPNPSERLARMDADGDGKISKSEVPEQMLQRWDRMDTNSDGFIDQQELRELAARFPRPAANGGKDPCGLNTKPTY